MAVFPTLTPSARTFTPGEYPHSAFAGMSGVQVRVRNSNVMLSSQLRLTFVAISESQMLSILGHYQAQRGSFESFSLPSAVWSGANSPSDYQQSGYGWRYIDPPSVTDRMCADAYDVELTLETVPPEGTALSGLSSIIIASLSGGAPITTSGLNVTVTASIMVGGATPSGLAETVTASLAAGSAGGAVGAAGLSQTVWVGLTTQASALNSTVTVSLAAGTGSGNVIPDPHFSSVTLLLHMDGSNNSTTFTDSSSAARAITPYGNAKISTTQTKFGGASALFDGSSDYLRATAATDLQFSGDFTIEMWVYPLGTSDYILGSSGTDGNTQVFRLNETSTGRLSFFLNGSQVFSATAAGITANTWQHLAIARSGSSTRMFVNGAQVGATNTTWNSAFRMDVIGTFFFNGSRYTGSGGPYDFNGYIDDVRVTKGVARYTSNFTPPSAAFPDA